jgi:hypothetical protein
MTWLECSFRQPLGRSELRSFNLACNHLSQISYSDFSLTFDRDSTYSTWQRLSDDLRPEDTIQITPKAIYVGWVNYIREARMSIVYDPIQPGRTVSSTPVGAFYDTRLDSAARIIKVRPGKPEDPIRCSVTCCQLGEHSTFHTLSYCWGDLTDLHDITINTTEICSTQDKATFKVSQSVVEAIRRLRSQDEEVAVWINQLCIDQSDKEERSQQVAMMADIYAVASAAHICLGEHDESIFTALRIIRDVVNYEWSVCRGGVACRCKGTRYTLSIETINGLLPDHSMKAMDGVIVSDHSYRAMGEIFREHAKSFSPEVSLAAGGDGKNILYLMSCLFSHPWFRRVRVIQEAILSQNGQVHCGAEVVPWKELVLFNKWFSSSKGEKDFNWGYLAAGVYLPEIFADAKPNGATVQKLSILDIFLGGLELQATDAREQLFALLPFGRETSNASEVSPELQVSYERPLERVLANFTRWCIRESRSLAVLSLIHGQRQRTWRRFCVPASKGDDILKPIWVVGGETRKKRAQATLDAQFDFTASGDAEPDSKILGVRISDMRCRK